MGIINLVTSEIIFSHNIIKICQTKSFIKLNYFSFFRLNVITVPLPEGNGVLQTIKRYILRTINKCSPFVLKELVQYIPSSLYI